VHPGTGRVEEEEKGSIIGKDFFGRALSKI
jgi:hypothetical protein